MAHDAGLVQVLELGMLGELLLAVLAHVNLDASLLEELHSLANLLSGARLGREQNQEVIHRPPAARKRRLNPC